MDKSLAPGFARTTYSGASGIHHAITPLNINPASVSGVDPAVTLKDTTSMSAEAAMEVFWTNALPLMGTSQTIGLCEIYKVDADTGEGTFLWGWDLGLAGTGENAGQALTMTTLSFKLVNGRTYKFTLMEGIFLPNQKDYIPYPVGGVVEDFNNYVISGDSPVYGRGNAYPFAGIARTTKTSDALRRRTGLA